MTQHMLIHEVMYAVCVLAITVTRVVPDGSGWFKRTSQMNRAKITVLVSTCRHTIEYCRLTRHKRWRVFGTLPKAAPG
jgi:hypothetical protein